MDAFYASVAELDHPELRGKAVIITLAGVVLDDDRFCGRVAVLGAGYQRACQG